MNRKIYEKLMADYEKIKPLTENKDVTISVNVPLFIRLLEYAKEDAGSDMALHKMTENILNMSNENSVLTMDQYDAIVKDVEK